MGGLENAEKFAESLRTAVRKIEEEIAPEVIRTLASNALTDAVYLTPRDKGYAQSGWIVTFDTPASDAPAEGASDKADAVVKRGQAVLDRAPKYPHIFLSNNVAYIEVLDAGRREGDFQTEDTVFGEVTSSRRRRASGSIKSPNGILTPTFEAMLDSITEDRTVE